MFFVNGERVTVQWKAKKRPASLQALSFIWCGTRSRLQAPLIEIQLFGCALAAPHQRYAKITP